MLTTAQLIQSYKNLFPPLKRYNFVLMGLNDTYKLRYEATFCCINLNAEVLEFANSLFFQHWFLADL